MVYQVRHKSTLEVKVVVIHTLERVHSGIQQNGAQTLEVSMGNENESS